MIDVIQSSAWHVDKTAGAEMTKVGRNSNDLEKTELIVIVMIV